MQEAALADVAGAGPVGVGVVQGVEVPAAVGGEAGDRVGAVGDQLPQLVGGLDAAGQTAAHGDDGDGLVVGAAGSGGHVAHVGALEEFGAQMAGETVGARVVEDGGDGQLEAGGPLESAVQLHGGQGVEAEVEEGAGEVAGRAGAVRAAEDRGDLLGDHGTQPPLLFRARAAVESGAQFFRLVLRPAFQLAFQRRRGFRVRPGLRVRMGCEFLEVAHCSTP